MNMKRKSTRSIALLSCLLLLIPVAAFSQAGNGTITGTVTDATGAVIPGAGVDVTNTETGVVFSTISTESGNYVAPGLPPGSYTITASLPGFKKLTRTNQALSSDQRCSIVVVRAGWSGSYGM